LAHEDRDHTTTLHRLAHGGEIERQTRATVAPGRRALPSTVTRPTNSMMACFAAVSFQDGNGSIGAMAGDSDVNTIVNPRATTASMRSGSHHRWISV
jgi:hypothetical protein